jgi:hypothetical protein
MICRGTPVEAAEEEARLERNAAAWRQRDADLEARYPGLLP